MSVAQQAPLIEVSPGAILPHPPSSRDAADGAISPTQAARLKMRSRGRVRNLRSQAIEVIDVSSSIAPTRWPRFPAPF